MAVFGALYYPSWDPPVQWLRSALLFFDQIQVIRPEEVTKPNYDAANLAVIDLLPDAFAEIRKKHYQMTLDSENEQLLDKTLDYIASRKKPDKNTLRVLVGTDEEVSLPGYSFLHVSKLPAKVTEALLRRSLINEQAEQLCRNGYGMRGFRVVETNASNVILALIADYYGRTTNLRTITDQNLGYLAAVLNRNPIRRREAAAMYLASAIMRIQVPAKIAELTPKQYVSLRRRYDDLREPFRRAVRTICDDYLLAGIGRANAS